MNVQSQNDGLTSTIVTVVLALVIVAAVMIPVVNTVTEPVKIPHTLLNTGSPMAMVDGDTHEMEITLDGSVFKVSTDGTEIMEVAKASDIPEPNPFNMFYAAINLSDGANADDAGQTRLSTDKGAIAYVLDPNNLRQTMDGYTFDSTLYNVMLIIPPIYWYSDGTSKLYVASSSTAFDGLTLKDYAHTYTSEGVTGHTDMIGIGVYEAYNLDGTMVSQADRTPTVSTSLTAFVGLANAGNTDNSNSTYRVWNYFDWTLYKIMCWFIMGNTDSQYMMGAGPTSMSASSVTGLTSSAIQKSANAQSSVSLLLENTWGSVYEWLGDTVNNAGTLVAGNTLVQPTSAANVVNVLEETVTMPPTIQGYYDTINTSSDAFGTAATIKSSGGTAGQGINDRFYGSSSPSRALIVGGAWTDGGHAGISCCNASGTWNSAYADFGSRLACSMGAGAAPVEMSDFAYVLTFDNSNGVTITDVQTRDNGTLTSRMPAGTTLNPYWEFGRSSVPDALSPDVEEAVIGMGDGSQIVLYGNGFVRVYSETGYDETDRITAESPMTFTITDAFAYTSQSTDKSIPITLYAGDGDYVQTVNGEGMFVDDTVLYFAFPYISSGTRGGVSVQFGYVGSGVLDNLDVTALAPSGATYENTEVTATATDGTEEGSLTGFDVTLKSYWNTVDYTEAYSHDVILPKEINYDTEGEGLGTAGIILGIVPIFVILGIILGIAAYMSPTIRGRI